VIPALTHSLTTNRFGHSKGNTDDYDWIQLAPDWAIAVRELRSAFGVLCGDAVVVPVEKRNLGDSCQRAMIIHHFEATFAEYRRRTSGLVLLFFSAIVLAEFLLPRQVEGADTQAQVAPNARVTLEFPDLPEMLETAGSGKKEPARMTFLLPQNYSANGKFPLFVFLNGGGGGRGDRLPLDRKTIGSNDFIIVNLPLFKSPGEKGLVTMTNIEIVSRSYRAMLGS
jgi:hypothetical protein